VAFVIANTAPADLLRPGWACAAVPKIMVCKKTAVTNAVIIRKEFNSRFLFIPFNILLLPDLINPAVFNADYFFPFSLCLIKLQKPE
jgi:hypothetical protein